MEWRELYVPIKRVMEKDPKNYIIFDDMIRYAASTDSTYYAVINDETHFFNGIQLDRKRGLILNLDEIVTYFKINDIKHFSVME